MLLGKMFNQKYCNVGMTQQQSLAKNQMQECPLANKDKKSDVGMVTGYKSEVGVVRMT